MSSLIPAHIAILAEPGSGLPLFITAIGWLATVALLACLVAVWNMELRRLVGVRTRELETRNTELLRETEVRRRAELARSETENQLRAIIDTEPECVKLVGPGCRLLEMNRAGLAMIEVDSIEEVRGKDLRNLILPEHQAAFMQLTEAVFEGRPGRLEFELTGVKGTRRWLETHAVPLRNQQGSITSLLAVTRDITAQRQALQALSLSEKQYRDLVETSNDLIWSVDVEGRWTFVNRQAARRILGYEPEEMQGRLFSEFMTRDRARRDLETFARIKEGKPHFQYETELLRKDGTPVQLSFNAIVLHDPRGNIAGTTGTAADITLRRRLEEQIRQSQKMEAVGTLAGGIAHDFNNLLTAILGYTEVLLVKPDQPATTRDGLLEIRKASTQAASLTRQLLAFSRKQVLSPRVIDLNVVVGNMDKMLHRLIGEHIQLVTQLDEDLPRVKADPGQIEQVILNLAINARDAMPEGGQLSIITSSTRVSEPESRATPGLTPGSHALIIVRDSGCGMDDTTSSQAFEPFFTTKEVGQGTGLGLSTVYGIVKQSNGHVQLRSKPGHGTEFRIYLPRAGDVEEIAEAVDETATAPAEPRGGQEVVLVVEDEDSVRSLVCHVLTARGYAVLEARNGQEALKSCEDRNGRIDLLVTDLVMPQMGGRELGRHVSRLYPDIRVLMISGYIDDLLIQQDVRTMAVAYLQKPFTPDELLGKVRETLDERIPKENAPHACEGV